MSNDMNHVFLIGRITRDLEDKTFSPAKDVNGKSRANLSIAVNRSVKKNNEWVDEASFFDVTLWGKQGEWLYKEGAKGKQIAVDGYLKQDTWEKDGKKNSKVVIIANNIQLIGGKSQGNQGASPSSGSAPAGNKPESNTDYNPSDGFPEDVPF